MFPQQPQLNSPQGQPPMQPQGQPMGQPQMPPSQENANTAMTNLGFANNMLTHLIQYKGKQNKPQIKPQTTPQASQPTQQPIQPKEEPKEASEPEEKDETNQVIIKVQEMEDKHIKELDELKKSIDNDNLEAKIKKGYEKKIADMEKSHAKEMKNVKDEIKSILNG